MMQLSNAIEILKVREIWRNPHLPPSNVNKSPTILPKNEDLEGREQEKYTAAKQLKAFRLRGYRGRLFYAGGPRLGSLRRGGRMGASASKKGYSKLSGSAMFSRVAGWGTVESGDSNFGAVWSPRSTAGADILQSLQQSMERQGSRSKEHLRSKL